MALRRNQLKDKFIHSRGNVDVTTYEDLINSTINIEDDGLDIDDQEGLVLKARGQQANMISLYLDQGASLPEWAISLQSENQRGFNITDGEGNSRLFIQREGNVGIGKTRPGYKLDVDGTIGMKGRAGTFLVKRVPADGRWQVLLDKLDPCQAFEVFAQIQFDGELPFGLTRAVVMLAGGEKGTRIRTKKASIGRGEFWEYFRSKIKFRWQLEKPESREQKPTYQLMVCSDRAYLRNRNQQGQIFVRGTKLWDPYFRDEVYHSSSDPQGGERAAVPQVTPPPTAHDQDDRWDQDVVYVRKKKK